MAIVQKTTREEISRYIEQWMERKKKAIIRQMQYCGDAAVNAARATDSYKDQTGNLRSSTGYVLVVDGNIVSRSGFEAVKNGAEGTRVGVAFAESIAKKYPRGICLIVVAGMNYAVHVKNKGYDVLDSAELTAERLVPKMLKQLGLK